MRLLTIVFAVACLTLFGRVAHCMQFPHSIAQSSSFRLSHDGHRSHSLLRALNHPASRQTFSQPSCDLSGNWTTTQWAIADSALTFNDYFDMFSVTAVAGRQASGNTKYNIRCLTNDRWAVNAQRYQCRTFNHVTGDSVVWSSGVMVIFNGSAVVNLDSGATMFGYNISCVSFECGWTQTNPECNFCGPRSVCPAVGNNAVPPVPCKQITFFDNWHAMQWTQVQPPSIIRKVHLIFMNHLDVGYNGIPISGFINNIVNIYFHEYFPRAIALSRTLATESPPLKFVYTTHAWLVSLYIDCPKYMSMAGIELVCPSEDNVRAFKDAIDNGWIVWHRGAFNMEPELMSPFLFAASMDLAAQLDAQFPSKQKSTVMSQRDVPGMTRGVIPLLDAAGVTAISVGVNCATVPPSVPTAFMWKDEPSGSEILSFWHPYGYPNDPGSSPENPRGLSREDCVVIEGFDEALCWAFRTDNNGPPLDTGELMNNYGVVQSLFPFADVEASTFENFADAVMKVKDRLPVVTEEIGDVWIQGAASDPQKMSYYRALARGYESCFSDKVCSMTQRDVINVTRFLLKLPEHTWGCNGFGWGVDFNGQWSNPLFEGNRSQKGYQWCEATWKEQRDFIDFTVDAAKGTVLQPYFDHELQQLPFDVPNMTGYIPISDLTATITMPHARIQFHRGGGLQKLEFPSIWPGEAWADASHRLGELKYVTCNQSQFNSTIYWGNRVLGEHEGLEEHTHAEAKTWSLTLTAVYVSPTNNSLWAHLTMPSETVSKYGGAKDVWLGYTDEPDGTGLTFDVRWFGKTATRMPEMFFLEFTPLPVSTAWKIWLDKMGSFIMPSEVVRGGNQYQHGSLSGAYFSPSAPKSATNFEGMNVYSRDAPLISPICAPVGAKFDTPTTLIWSAEKPCSVFSGFAFNLENNVWNTNYPQYYPFLKEQEDPMSGKDRFVQHIRWARSKK